MLGILKKQTVEQVRFAQADLFVANGYAVSFVPFGFAQPQGPWLIRNYHDDQRKEFPDHGVSIVCSKSPNAHIDLEKARASWLVAVTVRTENKLIASAVDALIATQYLRYREGVTTKHAPVRGTTGSRKALYVFGMDPTPVGHWLGVRYPFEAYESGLYKVPKTPGHTSMEIRSANSQFIASGLDTDAAPYGIGYDPHGAAYFWRGGLDLTQVRADELPVINEAGARSLLDAIVELFEAHGAERAV
jgi:hypothetical protein